MVKVKPFAALRPPKSIASEVASRPYDVLNSVEAKAEAGEKSLLHIIKPEIDFDPIIDEHTQEAYNKAVENFKLWQERGWLIQDSKEMYYVYAQTMDGRTQYGLVVGASVEDYLSGKIKKHELTRKDKEEDRMIHVRIQNANVEPVFFAYPDNSEINSIVKGVVESKSPEYNFVSEDGFGHHFWLIEDDALNAKITKIFSSIPALYVADGHHRTAAAALVGEEKRKNNPHHTGEEEYNYFLAVLFPESHLKIIDYNRVVKDLNGLSSEAFLAKVGEKFDIAEASTSPYKPAGKHEYGMFLDGKWYTLKSKEDSYPQNDPVLSLDSAVLQNNLLSPILGIEDPRTDKRIDFIGGIRGLKELERRVNEDMKVAFALYPVTIDDLMGVADAGQVMPPKSTWFEPKLRSGLFVHKLS